MLYQKRFFSVLLTSLFVFFLNLATLFSSQIGFSQEAGQVINQAADNEQRHGKMERRLGELDLKPEQAAKIKEIRALYHPKMDELKQNLRETRKKIEQLMLSETTLEQAKTQHENMQRILNSIGNLRFEIMWKTREVLTPEQRVKFYQKMQSHHEESKRHHSDRKPE